MEGGGIPEHVVVSRDGRIYQCLPIRAGWQCGACKLHHWPLRVHVGDYCECGARIEEAY